jgi:glucosamine kinase
MILIADSGTTKTEWSMITDLETSETIITSGINPFFQETDNISAILRREFKGAKKFEAIYFYGTGCINQEKQDVVRNALQQVFETNHIFVGSDLLAAAHSLCQQQKGFACILGTGSNSCYYNGSEIVSNVSPLGFILGDEGSGAVMGKKLIGDVLKKQLPTALISKFFETYPITNAEILENVYKKPFPSRYLAGFTKFLSDNMQYLEIENIVIGSFREFIIRNLLQYPDVHQSPIHFTGSIAWYFNVQLRKVVEEQGLILGEIVRAPMSGLIKYHNSTIAY